MLRRSFRLQNRGYYTEDGTPSVCYREVVYRIFRKRTNRGRVHHNVSSIEHYTSAWTTGTLPTITSASGRQVIRRNIVRTMCSFSASGFLSLLLLAFGIAHYTNMQMQMREVQQKVESLTRQMSMFVPLADTMPNFALESQGARVLHHLSSETYWPRKGIRIVWDRIFCWWYSSQVQRQVIQGHSLLYPGECWPFSGDRGHLFISLSHPVSITHVTLGHITKSQSPYGHIASAPREFSIYGMRTTDEEGAYLGTLVYNQDGPADQTFELPNPDKGVFRYVKLQIENNWGNIDNTCLYNFKVHGKLPSNGPVT